MPTSPWCDTVTLPSPDGSLIARIAEATEVGMGAPTRGLLEISSGMSIESCSPSMVWSDDSRYLAVPQWTRDRQQRLVVIDVVERLSVSLPGLFSVLELHRFVDGVVEGVDSPVWQPRRIRVSLRDVESGPLLPG